MALLVQFQYEAYRCCSVAAQAVEMAAMTHGASSHIEAQLSACVRVQEVARVSCRLKIRVLRVAESATIGRVNLVVAHKAIGHLRQRAPLGTIRDVQPAMTGRARIAGIKLCPHSLSSLRQIGLVIDCRRNHRRDITQFEM